MLNLLIKPLLGVAGQAVSGFVETKKAKAQLKLTEVQAATKLKQDQIAGKVNWEASAVDQMKGSWKDELILIEPSLFLSLRSQKQLERQHLIMV